MIINDLFITSHALLRYIERVKGVDIEALRDEILSDEVCEALSAGATGVTVNGVKMVAERGVIVTVLADEMRPKKKSKRGWRDLDAERQVQPASLAERKFEEAMDSATDYFERKKRNWFVKALDYLRKSG